MPLCDSSCQWSVYMAGPEGAAPASTPLSFVCNDAAVPASVTHSSSGSKVALAPQSCKVLHGHSGAELWNSHVDTAAEAAAPYTPILSLGPGKLKWQTWPQHAAASEDDRIASSHHDVALGLGAAGPTTTTAVGGDGACMATIMKNTHFPKPAGTDQPRAIPP